MATAEDYQLITNLKGPRGLTGETGPRGLPGFEAVPTDAGVASLVGTPSETKDALDAAYVAIPTSQDAGWIITPPSGYARPSRAGLVVTGDSKAYGNFGNTVAGDGGTFVAYLASGYWTHAAILLKQRVTTHIAGYPGGGTEDLMPRLDDDVLSLAPDYVLLDIGTNDIRGLKSRLEIIANLTTLYNRIIASGAIVIATTIMPAGDISTESRNDQHLVNAWIRANARTNPRNIILLDWAKVLTNSAGLPIPEYFDSIGVHLNSLGAFIVGTYIYEQLKGILPMNDALFSARDPFNFVNNPAMEGINGSPGPGLAQYWTTSGVLGAAKVPRTDGVIGEWQQITFNPAGIGYLRQAVGLPSAGTVMQAMVEFESDAEGWTDGTFDLSFVANDVGFSRRITALALFTGDVTVGGRHPSGVLTTPEFVIPANVSMGEIAVAKSGGGTMRFGRIELRMVDARL